MTRLAESSSSPCGDVLGEEHAGTGSETAEACSGEEVTLARSGAGWGGARGNRPSGSWRLVWLGWARTASSLGGGVDVRAIEAGCLL